LYKNKKGYKWKYKRNIKEIENEINKTKIYNKLNVFN
jgi:hypothetical protein